MSTPLSLSTTCQVCGTPLPTPHSVLDRLCSTCSQDQKVSKSYVDSVMPERQPTKLDNVQRLEDKQNSHGTGKAGVKDDKTKPMWNLLPWKAVNGLIKVLTFGAAKYAPNGWRIVPNGPDRYLSALLRHLYAIQSGERVDKDSGLRHIDHVVCNAAFLSELEED
jgi:Domain of unknown function (DUF5664)